MEIFVQYFKVINDLQKTPPKMFERVLNGILYAFDLLFFISFLFFKLFHLDFGFFIRSLPYGS